MSNFIDVNSPEHFKDLLSADLKRVSCLNFWAPWAEPCEAFTATIKELAGKYPQVLFLNVSPLLAAWWTRVEISMRRVLSSKIEAEDMADISESFNIDSVPTVLVLRVRTHLSRLLFPLSSRRLSWCTCVLDKEIGTRVEWRGAADSFVRRQVMWVTHVSWAATRMQHRPQDGFMAKS